MKKKGFTLIELLAVIVILAVIALIAVPIILNIIKNAKIKATEDSVYGFVEAIEFNNAVVGTNTENKSKITSDMKLSDILNNIEIKGDKPTSLIKIKVQSNKVEELEMTLNGFFCEYKKNVAKCSDDKTINSSILKDQGSFEKLLNDEKNITYIINNFNDFGNGMVENPDSFKIFAKNKTAMEQMINDSNWTGLILENPTLISKLDETDPIKVPKMTSNTAPSGETFASSYYNGFPAYKAFDQTGDYWGVAAGQSYKDQYIGYDFKEPVWLYKLEIQFYSGKQDTDYVLEGSNDKTSNYKIIKDGLHESNDLKIIYPDNYSKKYRYYRVRFLSSVPQSGSGNTVIPKIQFYSK